MSAPSPVTAANGPDSFVWWAWIPDHASEIADRSVEHLQLTLLSVAIGLLLSAALATLVLRHRVWQGPVTWATGVLYTIPSLALFGLLVPVFGLSQTTALVALVSYTLVVLVRNIVAGVDGVPAAVREAGQAMGYGRARRVLAVELPLAVPTIVAGIRIATVTTVGLVTISSVVGAGGYGAFINDGLDRGGFSTPIVVGAVLSMLLAVTLDLALLGLQWLLTPWTHAARSRVPG